MNGRHGCFEALPHGGLLLVVEKVLNNDFSATRLDDLMQDLHMLLVSAPGARAVRRPPRIAMSPPFGKFTLQLRHPQFADRRAHLRAPLIGA